MSDHKHELELTQAFAFAGWLLLFMCIGFMLGFKEGRSEMSVIMPVPPSEVDKMQQQFDDAAPPDWSRRDEA